MKSLRLLAGGILLASLTGCAVVPYDPYYGNYYPSSNYGPGPTYVAPYPAVVAPTVFVGGSVFYGRRFHRRHW